MTRKRVLMTGNEAAAEGAIRAGCRFYYGYPITPQNEIPEYMARRMPEVGGVFLQSESELAAINMVYGSAAAGKRAMTSSSSPGISLKMEGISYIAGSRLPAVIINVMRGGPGLGDISPSQADYFQATKGGGHGDYRMIVLAPSSAQEMADFTYLAFDLADEYRTPVMILADGRIGQMMEPVLLPDFKTDLPPKPWALTGAKGGRPANTVKSFYHITGELEKHNKLLQETYSRIAGKEVRFEYVGPAEPEILLVAYGTSARVCKEAVIHPDEETPALGLLRPITLWPFPSEQVRARSLSARAVLAVEMSAGQMVEDVRLAVEGARPVDLLGRMGGAVPSAREVCQAARSLSSRLMQREKKQ